MPKQTFFNLPADKRQRIIDLALDEFAHKPYSKASLSNIVARAGIAKGSMYQYFEDKKDLYKYLLNMAAEEKLAFIQQHVKLEGDFFQIFEQSMVAGTRFSLSHPQLGQVIINALDSPGDEGFQEFVTHGRQMALDFYEDMLKKGQANGSIRRDIDAKLIANLLYGLLSTGLADYILDSMGVTIREYLTNPEIGKELMDNKLIQHTINEIMKLLRNGLEEKG